MKSYLIQIQSDLRHLVVETQRVMIVDLNQDTFCHCGHNNGNPQLLVPDRIEIEISFLCSDSCFRKGASTESHAYIRIDSVRDSRNSRSIHHRKMFCAVYLCVCVSCECLSVSV